MDSQTLNDTLVAYISANPWIIPVLIWSIIWKLIALWKAAKNNHLTVFIVLAFLNTLGIAEMAYLLYLYLKSKKTDLVI
jgi:hypothetical protein